MVAIPYDRLSYVTAALQPDRAETVARLAKLAWWLDSAIPLPLLGRRIGFDSVIGFVPGVGDVATTALSAFIIWEARRLGLPKAKLARMVGNVAIDSTVGAIPLVGDLFDMGFKANRRNLAIVLDHLAETGEVPGGAAGSGRRR